MMTRGKGDLGRNVRALRTMPISELSELFGRWVPSCCREATKGRNRLFSPLQTFWLFLSQVMDADKSCRETVRKWLGWLAVCRGQTASPSTAAYCKARKRLQLEYIERILGGLVGAVDELETGEGLWCGRTVKVVDGSSVSMPDTRENQEVYPQPRSQKTGCGFPVMRVVALFSLASGTLLSLAKDKIAVSERDLFRRLWKILKPTEVVLSDRGFNSFADVHLLLAAGIDSVMRKHQRRGAGSKRIRKLGKRDWLVTWFKTAVRPRWIDPQQWRLFPDTLTLREITVVVDNPGFRSDSITIVTTLTDANRFPTQAFSQLYLRRWKAELYFRDIKITLGMDVLRCKTPEMAHKELLMFLIAYNFIRAFMFQAARTHGTSIDRISFKGTLSTLRQWAPLVLAKRLDNLDPRGIIDLLLFYLASDSIPDRPGRREPRARKRRPKNYPLLTQPRHQFVEIPHRNRYKKGLS